MKPALSADRGRAAQAALTPLLVAALLWRPEGCYVKRAGLPGPRAIRCGRTECRQRMMTAKSEATDLRASAFGYEALISCGRGELFGPGNAQLPLPPMLMFDRITSIGEDGGEHGKGHVRAELDVKPDLWFFACHFKGDPVMPGCLGLDALWQMLGFFLGWLGAPSQPRKKPSICHN